MDSQGARPPPFVPGWVAHVCVGHHIHVVARHENHRVFLVDQQGLLGRGLYFFYPRLFRLFYRSERHQL
jgi:hypothetical protein